MVEKQLTGTDQLIETDQLIDTDQLEIDLLSESGDRGHERSY